MPPLNLKIEDVYLLLGEKDVIIFQLGAEYNKLASEKAALEQELAELKNGRLERPDQHLHVLPGPGLAPGNIDRRGNPVPGESDKPASGVDAVEPSEQPVRGMVGERVVP